MLSSRYARDVQPHDVLTAQVGRIVHTGPVLHNREALGLPVRRVITIDCRTCAPLRRAALRAGRPGHRPEVDLMATQITGRIGLLRVEDSTGCVVAVDGHWFDVADILAEPDVGLVQLHGVSSTGAKEWHHLDAGAVLGQCLDFPCIGLRS